MSRGGRGGGWGGRGGKQKIGGQEVTWDYDPDLVIDTKPSEVFPKMDIPHTRAPTYFERAQVEHFKSIRRRIHDGPLYAVLGENARVGKSRKREAATFNPFEGMPTYTQKYKVALRELPRFDLRKPALQFFPEELWDILDPSRVTSKNKSARARGTKFQKLDNLKDLDDDGEKKQGEGEDGEEVLKDDDEEEEGEANPEDDFSEDDSEMGGDYNAENYFDDGEGDDDDGDGGGGGDDAYD